MFHGLFIEVKNHEKLYRQENNVPVYFRAWLIPLKCMSNTTTTRKMKGDIEHKNNMIRRLVNSVYKVQYSCKKRKVELRIDNQYVRGCYI